MIREALFFEDTCPQCFGGGAWRRNLIVDAPTDIFGTCLAAIRPLGVSLARCIGMQVTIDVDPPNVAKYLG